MYFRSAFARANVSGESVAQASSSRGAPSTMSAFVEVVGFAVALSGRGALAAAGVALRVAPGCTAQPAARADTRRRARARGIRIVPGLRASAPRGSVSRASASRGRRPCGPTCMKSTVRREPMASPPICSGSRARERHADLGREPVGHPAKRMLALPELRDVGDGAGGAHVVDADVHEAEQALGVRVGAEPVAELRARRGAARRSSCPRRGSRRARRPTRRTSRRSGVIV